MSVKQAFEEFLRARRDGLTARQQLWTAFDAGAQFAIGEICERADASASAPETGTGTAPEAPEKTWDCSICGRSNYVTITHCERCDYSRSIMRGGRLVPRDGQR